MASHGQRSMKHGSTCRMAQSLFDITSLISRRDGRQSFPGKPPNVKPILDNISWIMKQFFPREGAPCRRYTGLKVSNPSLDLTKVVHQSFSSTARNFRFTDVLDVALINGSRSVSLLDIAAPVEKQIQDIQFMGTDTSGH